MDAAAEAATVFRTNGMCRVCGSASMRVSTPLLAAVSKKRERGPWKSAGRIP